MSRAELGKVTLSQVRDDIIQPPPTPSGLQLNDHLIADDP